MVMNRVDMRYYGHAIDTSWLMDMAIYIYIVFQVSVMRVGIRYYGYTILL